MEIEKNTQQRKFTQFGTFSVAVLFPLLILFIIRLWSSENNDLYVNLLLVFIFLICLLFFYKISLSIDRKQVVMKLGIGLFKKTYSLSTIESCRPVTNPFLYGIGIRIIPNGFLYNVSGLKAVELKFKNKKTLVRLGTDKPEEVCDAIQKQMKP